MFCHSLLSDLVFENPLWQTTDSIARALSAHRSIPAPLKSVVSVAGVGSAQGVFSAAEPIHAQAADPVLTAIFDQKRSTPFAAAACSASEPVSIEKIASEFHVFTAAANLILARVSNLIKVRTQIIMTNARSFALNSIK